MRSFWGILLVGVLALPAWADEPAKPNTLTPKEVEDGWMLLFDGKTTFGWNTKGDVKVTDGTIQLGGKQRATIDFDTGFGDFELQFDYQTDRGILVCRLPKDPKEQKNTDFYAPLTVHPNEGKGWNRNVSEVRFDAAKNTWSSRAKIFNPSGKETDVVTWNYAGGSISYAHPLTLQFLVPASGSLVLRNIKLKPLGLKPIFNGKDLTGWKEIKTNRTKSQFTVASEGWIHLKNGPGDLQTEGQWDDFVLQIDCKSNGKHLNSGVFFRCQPGKYQQGYEAQIHNGFFPDPAKNYTLKEYDPKTHKQIGEKKVKYAAMDYGTGAIYNRQPARFQVAKDHEWFTMTIVAEGNHFAVWVNGIEVTDWTDNRPPSDNARNGFRKEKGPISLQGHDPTTDLDFRNIRIAELPRSAGNPKSSNEKK